MCGGINEQYIISNPFDFAGSELTYTLKGGDYVNGHSVLLISSMKCSRERIRSFSTRVQPSDDVFEPTCQSCHVKDAQQLMSHIIRL